MLALPMSPFLRYNPRLPRRVIDPREISVCTNAEIQDGSVVRSMGWSQLTDLITPAKVRHMAEHIKNDGTRYLCMMTHSHFFVYDPSDSSLTDLTRPGLYGGSYKWSSCSYGDWFFFTNGVDCIQKWDGNKANAATDVSGVNMRPSLIMTFGAHLICAVDNNEALTDSVGLKKFSWSAVGDPSDFSSPTSGSAYVYEGSGSITGMAPITRDMIAIYKTESVHLIEYVGSPMYFSFRTSLSGIGLDSWRGFTQYGDKHIVLTNNGLRTFDGSSVAPFAVEIDPVLATYYPNNNYSWAQLIMDTYNNDLWIFLPEGGSEWDFKSAVKYSFNDNSWSLQTGFDAYSVCLMRMGSATDTFRLVMSDMLTKVYKADPAVNTRHGDVYTSTVETAMVCPGMVLFQITTVNTELVQIDVGLDYGDPDIYIGVSDRGDESITWHGPYSIDANGHVYTTVVGRWFIFRIQDTADFSIHTLTPWFVQRGVV